MISAGFWSWKRDLNTRPADYESAAFLRCFHPLRFPCGSQCGSADFPLRICVAINNKEGPVPQIQREEATLPSAAQPTYRRPGFLGIPVYPPLGGASRAPGLPQPAAWRTCGRGPHPLRERRQMLTGRPPSRPCRPCVPLSGGERDHTDAPIEAARPHENSEEEYLRGPRFGPFGGVRFSY